MSRSLPPALSGTTVRILESGEGTHAYLRITGLPELHALYVDGRITDAELDRFAARLWEGLPADLDLGIVDHEDVLLQLPAGHRARPSHRDTLPLDLTRVADALPPSEHAPSLVLPCPRHNCGGRLWLRVETRRRWWWPFTGCRTLITFRCGRCGLRLDRSSAPEMASTITEGLDGLRVWAIRYLP